MGDSAPTPFCQKHKSYRTGLFNSATTPRNVVILGPINSIPVSRNGIAPVSGTGV